MYFKPIEYKNSKHWNRNVVKFTELSSLVAPEVVILTTSGATSDENFVNLATFSLL